MSFTEENQNTDIFHIITPPSHCDILPSSQLKFVWSLKQKCILTYRMHQAPLPYYDFIPNLAYCHHSQNSLFKGYKGLKSPLKIKTCTTNFIWHFIFFSTVFHIKAIKKLHKIRILLSVFSANINEYLENYFSQSLKWEQDFFCFNSIPCIHISYYYYFCIFNTYAMSVYRNVHPKDPRGTHQQWQDALVLLPSHLLEHFRKKSTEEFEQRLFSPS